MLIIIDNLIALVKVFLIVGVVLIPICFLWNKFFKDKFFLEKKKHVLRVWLVATIMVFLYDTKMPGYQELALACEESAVYELGDPITVNGYYVDGLYSGRAWRDVIVEKGGDYVEINIDDVKDYREYPEAGIWRIEKQPISSQRCTPFLQKILDRKHPNHPFTKNYCLSAEKVDSPKSEYGYYFDIKRKVLNTKYDSVISSLESRVVNLKNDFILSKSVTYKLLPYKNHGLHYGFSLHCSSTTHNEKKKGYYRSIGEVLSATLIIKENENAKL